MFKVWYGSQRRTGDVTAHFKRILERASVKKLLGYEKEVNEGFAKTA